MLILSSSVILQFGVQNYSKIGLIQNKCVRNRLLAASIVTVGIILSAAVVVVFFLKKARSKQSDAHAETHPHGQVAEYYAEGHAQAEADNHTAAG